MLTKTLIVLVKHFEGCSLTAYPDPGTGDAPWTIGYGATGGGIGPGVKWTQEQADNRLIQDLTRFSKTVKNFLYGVPVNQNQWDALTSFAYNVGGWKSSTLFSLIRRQKYGDAAQEFTKWVFANHKVLPGLVKRREAEKTLFETPV